MSLPFINDNYLCEELVEPPDETHLNDKYQEGWGLVSVTNRGSKWPCVFERVPVSMVFKVTPPYESPSEEDS